MVGGSQVRLTQIQKTVLQSLRIQHRKTPACHNVRQIVMLLQIGIKIQCVLTHTPFNLCVRHLRFHIVRIFTQQIKIVKTYLNVVICLNRPASAADTPCSCCKNQKSHNHPSFIFSHFSFLHNFVFYPFCISESHMDRVHDVV